MNTTNPIARNSTVINQANQNKSQTKRLHKLRGSENQPLSDAAQKSFSTHLQNYRSVQSASSHGPKTIKK